MGAGTFHWADYLVSALSLSIGPLLTVYFMLTGGRQKTTDEYLLGDKSMSAVAVGASLMASTFNAVFFLGATAEVYFRGAIFIVLAFSWIPVGLATAFVFVPSWKKHNVTSAYEYLEKRFQSTLIRVWAAILFCAKCILFLSVVLFTPAMALSHVTGMNIHLSIILSGSICTLYTVLGGIKTVVWTDTAQTVIMMTGMVVICIVGTVSAGGVDAVIIGAKENGRFNFVNFSLDPRERHTVWVLTVGFAFVWATSFLADQTHVQRYQAVRSVRDAQWAVLVNTIIIFFAYLTVGIVGAVASVYFKDCDPLLNGDITNGDQMLPYFFMILLSSYPGLPGLFISAIFAAALSTVSSSINSLGAVFLEDFAKPFMRWRNMPIPESREHIYAKVLSGIFGVMSISLSYLAPILGDVIIQIPPTVFGAVGGPLFSIFLLAFYVPFANKWGALFGSVIGVVLSLWIGLGAILFGPSAIDDNLAVGQCLPVNYTSALLDNNITQRNTTMAMTTGTLEQSMSALDYTYHISYGWLAAIAVIVTFISGMIISAITNACCNCQTKMVEISDHDMVDIPETKEFISPEKPAP